MTNPEERAPGRKGVDHLFAQRTERHQRAFEFPSKTRVVKASSFEAEPTHLAAAERGRA